MKEHLTGRCLCGQVEYEAKGDFSPVTACHCAQCRQWSGNAWLSIGASLANFAIIKGDASLKWYESSDFARRGFCSECGTSLFWHADRDNDHSHYIALSALTIDDLKGKRLGRHIFTGHKGDCYDIADGLPQRED